MSANNVEMNIVEVVAYDPNAPMANAPVAIIDAENVVVEPDDEEIQFVKDLDEIEDFIAYLFDEGEISDVAFTEIGGLLSLIQQNKWYKRIEKRIENKQQGRVRERFTEIEKLNDPRFKTCPDCNSRVINLKEHQGRRCCVKEATKLKLKAVKKQKVSALMTAATLDLTDAIARSEQYKKNIMSAMESEMEEEDYEEENNKVWVIKTYEYNHTTKAIDYAGLWEDSETGNKEFKTEEEAREAFGYATEGDKGYIAVELIEIDPDSEVRENVIEEWEDNIEDYIDVEVEDEDA